MKGLETRGLLPFLISLVFYIILGPVILILCLVNEIVRLGVSFYLQRKHDGKIVLVPDGADALWTLKRKKRTRMVVIVIKVEKQIPAQVIKENFENKIFQSQDSSGQRPYLKLKNILVTKCGYACWKRDDNFNFNNHIRSLAANKVFSKKDIQKEVNQMFPDMSENKPQWEVVLVPRFVENVGESETSLFIFQFQHAYTDGFSLCTMFKNQMSSNYTYFVDPKKFEIPLGKKVLFYLNAVIFGPYAFILICLNKFKCFWPRQISNNQTQGGTSYTWTNSIDLEAFQKLRKKLDYATIPTIVENAFISAAKEILPAGRVPEQLSVGELAALLPYPNERPQNRFTVFMFNINSNQTDFERIRASKKASWKGMTGPWIPLTFLMFKISGRMPVFMHYIVLGGGSNSLMMSNLPLSKTKFRMLDVADASEVWAFPPQPNDTGIILFAAAYHNTLKITASADPTWLKEEELVKIVERIPKVLDEWAKILD